jgi:DNA primase
MVKLAQSTIKYLIEVEFSAEGTVEKPDVIGAVFGQTEGLLGSDLDLRELQRTGRVGRIEAEITTTNGKTEGKITLPSSLSASETALLAASLETIERVGPCVSHLKVATIKDMREQRREFVVERAKNILENLIGDELPDSYLLTEKLKETVRVSQIQEYKGLSAGPEIQSADEIIIVEGRADVINLLKSGIKNVIGTNGMNISEAITELAKEKMSILFVDGDRGGDLIIKDALQTIDLDYIAKAPEGKEVEELSKKEIFKALREKISIEEYKTQLKEKE